MGTAASAGDTITVGITVETIKVNISKKLFSSKERSLPNFSIQKVDLKNMFSAS
ncbi:MAG: hypothetical protein M1540_08325 [Candidatus Bathyarchaeota archaeon]|nr:hypothetical protein [Candidatus Bathyarchaeota archaeon]